MDFVRKKNSCRKKIVFKIKNKTARTVNSVHYVHLLESETELIVNSNKHVFIEFLNYVIMKLFKFDNIAILIN